MLKNDNVNLVIALLIAIGLWTYVMVEVNPTKDSTIKDVPITFLNEATLEDNALTLLSVSDTTVDVTVKGRVSDLKGVKKEDIKIYADLEGYKAGEHTVRLQIGRIDNVEIECRQKITIVVDPLVSVEKPVWVTLSGNLNDDLEPYIVQVSPQSTLVTGAKTLVDSIVRVNAPLDVEKVGNELKAFMVSLSPVNGAGDTVNEVTLDVSSASVSAVNLNKKTVRLDVPVTGLDTMDTSRVVTVPKTITIKGMDADMVGITSVTAEPVDVSNIFEDTTIPIVPVLPEGVEVAANSQDLQVQITVKGIASRVFEYSKDAVIAEGVAEDAMVSLEDVAIRLTVTGKEAVTSYLAEGDFSFAVNVKNLEAGTHQVELECRYDKDLELVNFEPKLVTVVISSNQTDSEESADEDSGTAAGGDAENETENGEGSDSGIQESSGVQNDDETAPEA